MSARAVTATEQALLESEGQRSKTWLGIYNPPVVYSARVNQAFSSTDRVSQLTYDSGSGTLAAVLPGMLLLVGSSAGAADKGQARIRAVSTETVIFIGETSEIPFADNDYLTILDDFPLMNKIASSIGGVVRIDATTLYSGQHANRAPVPIMGPLVAALELAGASASLERDFSASYCPGPTINAYLVEASGPAAVTITGADTATPTLTFSVAGWYRVRLTLTGANGAVAAGVRWVYVWDQAHLPQAVGIEPPKGDMEAGGWQFDVLMSDRAGLDEIRDGALVVLFSEDWYGETKQSIGPVVGYENVIACGWIAGETIHWNPRAGRVKFSVLGPAGILSQLEGQAFTLSDADAAPVNWTQMQGLTVDAALWHVVSWRSTIAAVCDVHLPGSTARAQTISAPPGSAWEQLNAIAGRIGARALSNRYGQIYIEVDPQYMAVADRAAIPVVMDLGKNDWREEIELEHQVRKRCSMVELGADTWNGTAARRVWSRAPGNQGSQHGDPAALDGYIVADQTAANALAGMIYAQRNNPYPLEPVRLASNNRMIDICPRQYLTQSIQAADTARGITWTAQRLIPRYVELVITGGRIRTEIECEAETSGAAGVTYIPPANPRQNLPLVPGLPGMPDAPAAPDFPLYPGPGTWTPETDTPLPELDPCMDEIDAPANGPFAIMFDKTDFSAGGQTVAYLPCGVRRGDAVNPTRLSVYANLIDEATFNAVRCYAVDANRTKLITGNYISGHYYYQDHTWQFNPPAGVHVAGFMLELPEQDVYYPTGPGTLVNFELQNGEAQYLAKMHFPGPPGAFFIDQGGGYSDFVFRLISAPGTALPGGRLYVTYDILISGGGNPPNFFVSGGDPNHEPSLGNGSSWAGGDEDLGTHTISMGNNSGFADDGYFAIRVGYVPPYSIYGQITKLEWVVSASEKYTLWGAGKTTGQERILLSDARVYNICSGED